MLRNKPTTFAMSNVQE